MSISNKEIFNNAATGIRGGLLAPFAALGVMYGVDQLADASPETAMLASGLTFALTALGSFAIAARKSGHALFCTKTYPTVVGFLCGMTLMTTAIDSVTSIAQRSLEKENDRLKEELLQEKKKQAPALRIINGKPTA